MWQCCAQELSERVAHILRGGLGAFQPAAAQILRDVSLPPVLPTAEQLSERFCALRMFHPRRVARPPPPLLPPFSPFPHNTTAPPRT